MNQRTLISAAASLAGFNHCRRHRCIWGPGRGVGIIVSRTRRGRTWWMDRGGYGGRLFGTVVVAHGEYSNRPFCYRTSLRNYTVEFAGLDS